MADVVKYKKLSAEDNGVLSDSETSHDESSKSSAVDIELVSEIDSPSRSEKRRRLIPCCSGPRFTKLCFATIVFGLLVFAVALAISFVITLLIKEPSPPQYNGNKHY